MIYFFCGAPKNASHFHMFVLTESLSQKNIPYRKVGNEIFHNHDIKKGINLLTECDQNTDKLFVCKGHWGKKNEREILMSIDNIRVFLIWRDLRDVVVSHFYYNINKFNKLYRNFSTYYWLGGGRTVALAQVKYMRVWDVVSDNPKVHVSYFNDLKNNFKSAAKNLLDFAGIKNIDLDDLEKRLSLDQLRTKHNDPSGIFFRRGIVGEHSEVIHSRAIYNDLKRIENMSATSLKFQYIITKLAEIAIYRSGRILNFRKRNV